MMLCEKCGTPLEDGKCPKCENTENRDMKSTKKEKNHNMAIFAIVLSVISIGLLVGGFYALSSPKTIALQSVSNWSGLVKKSLVQKDNKLLENIQSHDQIQVDSGLSLEMDPILEAGFEKFGFKVSYNEDRKSSKSKFGLQMLLDDGSFGIDGILANNKIYLKMQDVLEQYHYVDMEYLTLFENSGSFDQDKLIDLVFDNIKKSIDEDDFKKTKETVTLGDKTKKTTKISYEVTSKKLLQVCINILEDIKNDKELMAIFEEAYGNEEESFSTQLRTLIGLLKAQLNEKDETLFYYNVYYYGFNNIVMEEFTDNETAIQFYHYEKTEEIKVTDLASKTNYFTMKIVSGKENSEVTGFVLTYPYRGVYIEKDKEKSLKLTFDLEDDEELVCELNSQVTEKNDSYQVQTDFILGGTSEGVKIEQAMKLSMNTVYTFDQKVDTTGIEDAKAFDAMTTEEQMALLEAIENHPFLAPIITWINEESSSFDDSDWDLDDSDLDTGNLDM